MITAIVGLNVARLRIKPDHRGRHLHHVAHAVQLAVAVVNVLLGERVRLVPVVGGSGSVGNVIARLGDLDLSVGVEIAQTVDEFGEPPRLGLADLKQTLLTLDAL